MCESNVYIEQKGTDQLLMEDVSALRVNKDGLTIENVLGEKKRVRARLREADFCGHRVVLEPLVPLPDSLEELIQRAVSFHGHLGPFLVLGLRMGLLAKRRLGFEGHFDVRGLALTGAQTPVSCIVDGLQTATGATLGKGNIKVGEMQGGRPAARFDSNGRTVQIAVCAHALERIASVARRVSTELAAARIAGLPDGELFEVRE